MRPGQPSQTALLIARSTIVASGYPGWSRFFDPLSVKLCRAFVEDHLAWPKLQLRIYRTSIYRMAMAWLERMTLPGIQLHYALRKKLIEDEVRFAIGAGYDRLEVHGAGFDTLATRLAVEFPEFGVMEIDHPDTQQAKRHSLGRLGHLGDTIKFQALDLNQHGEHQRSPGHVKTPTVVVAEGVLMYLSEPAVRRFFSGLRQAFQAPVRVVFTFMAPDRDNRLRFHNSSRLIEHWLDLRGEPFTWGISPNALGAFLKKCGFVLEYLVDHDALRQRYLGDWSGTRLALAEGEMIAVARSDI